MATQFQNADARAGLRRLVASEVSEALTRQPGLAKTVAANTAQIVAAVAAAVVAPPPAQQQRRKNKRAAVADLIAAPARGGAPRARPVLSDTTQLRTATAGGIGKLIGLRADFPQRRRGSWRE